MHLKVLNHSPYIFDLIQCGVFASLKQSLKEQMFNSNAGVKLSVREWLRKQPFEFHSQASIH